MGFAYKLELYAHCVDEDVDELSELFALRIMFTLLLLLLPCQIIHWIQTISSMPTRHQ